MKRGRHVKFYISKNDGAQCRQYSVEVNCRKVCQAKDLIETPIMQSLNMTNFY